MDWERREEDSHGQFSRGGRSIDCQWIGAGISKASHMCAQGAVAGYGHSSAKTSRRPPPSSKRDAPKRRSRLLASLCCPCRSTAVRPAPQPRSRPAEFNRALTHHVVHTRTTPRRSSIQAELTDERGQQLVLVRAASDGDKRRTHEHGQRARGDRSEAWWTEQHEG